MLRKNIKIINKLGVHARPAALLVKLASKFESDIYISKGGQEVNGKSIMGVMMLAAEPGSTLTVSISGIDEKAAMEAIDELISVRKFDE